MSEGRPAGLKSWIRDMLRRAAKPLTAENDPWANDPEEITVAGGTDAPEFLVNRDLPEWEELCRVRAIEVAKGD